MRVGHIYRIRNVISSDIYIGSTVQIPRLRWLVHRAKLRKGTHHSPILQNAWNKYGETAFSFEIIERCGEISELDLERKEQSYLDKLNPKYNASRIIARNEHAQKKATEARIKEYVLTSPSNKEIQIRNLSKFCRDNGLNRDRLQMVAKGKATHYKNWLCRHIHNTQEEWEKIRKIPRGDRNWANRQITK